MTNTIELTLKSVDSILDLSNFLKNFFNAYTRIIPEAEASDGIVLYAKIDGRKYFLYPHLCKNHVALFVMIGGAVKIYATNDLLKELYGFSINENPTASFQTISGLVEFLKEELQQRVNIPEPEVSNMELIDLEEREKNLNAWAELFRKLIPYGVIFTDQRKEIVSQSNFIFELEVPGKPVPQEMAIKNEYHAGGYYEDTGMDSLHFYPGGEDWAENYKAVVEHLKKIYEIPNLNF
jgi:hypothetical protein